MNESGDKQRAASARESISDATARIEELINVADSLTEPLDKLRDHAHAVGMELARAADRLREFSSSPTEAAQEDVDSPTSTDVEAPEGEVTEVGDVSKEALLRATRMAIAGSRRDEIERVLEIEFQVAEPAAVVDEVLGPNSA